MRRGWLVLALYVGCDAAPTTLRVTVRVAMGPQPQRLTVSLFDAHHALVDRKPLVSPKLPGSLLVTRLPDDARELRVVVRSDDAGELGGARVTSVPHGEARAEVALSTATVDTDGDGVPDDLDDCPTVPDPLQPNAAGSGPGDACRGALDLSAAAVDGAADLAVPLDGATSDLAARDASSDLAGGDLASSASRCPGGLLLCEGFENGFDTTTLWNPITTFRPLDGGGNLPTFTVDNVHTYRGTHALHIHVDPITVTGYVQAKIGENAAAPHGTMFMRAFFYLPSTPVMATDTELISVVQESDPYAGMQLGLNSGGGLGFSSWTGNGANVDSATSMPFNRWVCVEWEIVESSPLDGGTGSVHAWIDDVEVNDLRVGGLWTLPWLGAVAFGFDFTASNNLSAIDAWIDELAVDGQRITCSK
jgi:hypothetical protein